MPALIRAQLVKPLKIAIILILAIFFVAPAAGGALPALALSAPATSLPAALQFTFVASGLTQPLFVTNAGDGSQRLFIVQQTGQIRIFKNGSLLAAPFLDISGLSGFTGSNSEQGLLALAFDPSYSTNSTFYITYTTNIAGPTFPFTTTLARYQVSGNADVANSSGTVLLSIPKKHANHNGGMIAFGPDGYLYFSMGDGGGAGDIPDANAQNLNSLLGKLLRIDVHNTDPGLNYAIPMNNPFRGMAGKRGEIWAYGLRNPWRLAFDSSTGDIFIGDVGQDIEEEIDFQPASSNGGENYGWNILEGNLCFNTQNFGSPLSNCNKTGKTAPVAVYDHGTNESNGCAVIGGYVYRGNAQPALQGVYFYGDICSGRVLGLIRNPPDTSWTGSLLASTSYSTSSFGQGEDGELYLTDYSGGIVYHISAALLVRPHPSNGGQVCMRPNVGVDLILTDLTRKPNGSFDPATVSLELDGADVTPLATMSQDLSYPASRASVSYTPGADLALGAHTVTFMYPTDIGPTFVPWGFTVASTCTSTLQGLAATDTPNSGLIPLELPTDILVSQEAAPETSTETPEPSVTPSLTSVPRSTPVSLPREDKYPLLIDRPR